MDYSYYTISDIKLELVGSQEMGCNHSHAVVQLVNIITHEIIMH